jgi:hypothetical protein
LPLIRRKPSTRQRKVDFRSAPCWSITLRSLDPRAVLVALEPKAPLLVARHIARMAFPSLLALRLISHLVRRQHVRDGKLQLIWFSGMGRHAVDFAFGVGCTLLGVGAVGLDVPEAVLGAHEDRGGVRLTFEGIGFAEVGGEEVGFLDAVGFAAGGGAYVVAEFVFGTGGAEDPLIVGGEGLDFVGFAAVRGGVVVIFRLVIHEREAEATVWRRAVERTLLRLGAVLDLLPISVVAADFESRSAIIARATVDVGYRALLGLRNKSLTVTATVGHVGLSKAQRRLGTLLGRLPISFSAASLKGIARAADVVSN